MGGDTSGPTPDVPMATTLPVTSVPRATSKNLQALLHKLSVDEKTKPHQFWDTQPVPKLGESNISLSTL